MKRYGEGVAYCLCLPNAHVCNSAHFAGRGMRLARWCALPTWASAGIHYDIDVPYTARPAAQLVERIICSLRRRLEIMEFSSAEVAEVAEVLSDIFGL